MTSSSSSSVSSSSSSAGGKRKASVAGIGQEDSKKVWAVDKMKVTPQRNTLRGQGLETSGSKEVLMDRLKTAILSNPEMVLLDDDDGDGSWRRFNFDDSDEECFPARQKGRGSLQSRLQ